MQLSHCLKRRTSVNHLYQAASLVISPSNHSTYECLQAVSKHSNDHGGLTKHIFLLSRSGNMAIGKMWSKCAVENIARLGSFSIVCNYQFYFF